MQSVAQRCTGRFALPGLNQYAQCMFKSIQIENTDTPRFSQELLSGRSGKVENCSNHMVKYVCVSKDVQFKSKLQYTGSWPAPVWRPRHLCCHPAVFFHPLLLICLSFVQGKFAASLKPVIIQDLFYSFKNWVLWNWVRRGESFFFTGVYITTSVLSVHIYGVSALLTGRDSIAPSLSIP
jgi:hypothetical protein